MFLQEGADKQAAEAQHCSAQDSESKQSAIKSDQSSQDKSSAPEDPKQQQQQPASDAQNSDGHADVSAPRQPVSAEAMQLTDAPEGAAGGSAADPHAAVSHDTAAHGNSKADGVSDVPDQPTAAPVLFTIDVSEEVSGISAPIHFTDGSEATVVSARGVTVQVRLLLLYFTLMQVGPLRALTSFLAVAAALCGGIKQGILSMYSRTLSHTLCPVRGPCLCSQSLCMCELSLPRILIGASAGFCLPRMKWQTCCLVRECSEQALWLRLRRRW